MPEEIILSYSNSGKPSNIITETPPVNNRPTNPVETEQVNTNNVDQDDKTNSGAGSEVEKDAASDSDNALTVKYTVEELEAKLKAEVVAIADSIGADSGGTKGDVISSILAKQEETT